MDKKPRGVKPYSNPNKRAIGAKVNEEVWERFKKMCKGMGRCAGDVLDDLMEEWLRKQEEWGDKN